MKKIKIVTAYFDIGRADSEVSPRSNNEYIDYFRFWAGIQNEMVIYCQSDYEMQIRSIREEHGLENKTEIITVDNVFGIEPSLLARMEKIQNDTSFSDFRYYSKAMSNNAKYDYIMLMKYWFMADAARRSKEDCFIAWNDFGYNHGNAYYKNSKDFSFEWEYDFPERINAFCLKNPDSQSLIDSLQFQCDCFIGSPIIIPKKMCEWSWNNIKGAMEALLDIGCIDDDQHLQLMVYKKNPELYSIVICDWFEAFSICSDRKFSLNKKDGKSHKGEKRYVKLWLKRVKRRIRLCLMKFRKQDKDVVRKDDFLIRTETRKIKYYG